MADSIKKKGIVISTCKATIDFLAICLLSIPKGYKVAIVINNSNDYPGIMLLPENLQPREVTICKNDWNGFELGGIQRGAELFDEFVFLTDTCIIKNPDLIEKLFAHEGSMSLCGNFFSYLGKFVSSKLREVGMPRVENKKQAIHEERFWTEKYITSDPNYKLFDPQLPIETDVFGEVHGENRMIIENEFLVKYKGTYGANAGQVK